MSTEFVISDTSYNSVVSLQRQPSLFFPVRRIIALSRYSVNRVCSFRYVIEEPWLATVSNEFVISGTSYNSVVSLHRQPSLLFPIRRIIALSRYSVNRVCYFRYVIYYSCLTTVLTEFVISDTSYNSVISLQRQPSLLFPIRRIIALSRYSVNRVWCFRYVLYYSCLTTSSTEFVISDTSYNSVVSLQC